MTAADNAAQETAKLDQEERMLIDRLTSDQARLQVLKVQKAALVPLLAEPEVKPASTASPKPAK